MHQYYRYEYTCMWVMVGTYVDFVARLLTDGQREDRRLDVGRRLVPGERVVGLGHRLKRENTTLENIVEER